MYTRSKKRQNNKGLHGQPYFNPNIIGIAVKNGSEVTYATRFTYKDYRAKINSSGKCKELSKVFHSKQRFTLSYAFFKSIKIAHKWDFLNKARCTSVYRIRAQSSTLKYLRKPAAYTGARSDFLKANSYTKELIIVLYNFVKTFITEME